MQVTKKAKDDEVRGAAYKKMVKAMLERLNVEVLYRLDVNYNIESRGLDSMLGRTAHLLILDNEQLLQMIVNRYRKIFY